MIVTVTREGNDITNTVVTASNKALAIETLHGKIIKADTADADKTMLADVVLAPTMKAARAAKYPH